MADKERRSATQPTRRSSLRRFRRKSDRLAGIAHRMEWIEPTASSSAGPHVEGIVEIKEHAPRPERRIGGAGRRSGDLARALQTGEAVTFQVGKGYLAKKALSKAGKAGKLALGAITLYDMVNKQ